MVVSLIYKYSLYCFYSLLSTKKIIRISQENLVILKSLFLNYAKFGGHKGFF